MSQGTDTIDLKLTWRGALPMLLAVLSDGTPEGRKKAAEELHKMAAAADAAAELREAVPRSRALVVINGGVAEHVCDSEVDMEVFDDDNFKDDPGKTGRIPERFRDLAERLGYADRLADSSPAAARPRS
ncbi:MAG: hypothetical protein BroJett021_34580 [Chloroflexota bacterium]|nr:MAG: hypothetical protein BroJett021_34580 [Chloroflexota bacterium]